MEDSCLKRLPSDIILNIFWKLPAESVLDCKLVCGAWRNLIKLHVNTSYFAYRHLQCQHGHELIHQEPDQSRRNDSDSAMLSFISCFNGRDLYYGEYYSDYKMMNPGKPENYSTRRISFKFPTHEGIGLVGSCNGLICLSAKIIYKLTNRVFYAEPLNICNPITREIMKLPRISVDKKIDDRVGIVHGFGYHPITNEYKVIRISYMDECTDYKPPYKGQVDVYTLGSGGGWRTKGETNYCLLPNTNAASVCANGALHWFQVGSENIVAFDLADEKFYLLQTPNNYKTEPINRELRIFRASLCLVNEFLCHGLWAWDFWFLEEEADRSYQPKELNSPCWSKEHTMYAKCLKSPRLFTFLEGGKILLTNYLGYIFSCSRESCIAHDHWESDTDGESWVLPIPHTNSFVSLKALGEKNVHTFTQEDERKSSCTKTSIINNCTNNF